MGLFNRKSFTRRYYEQLMEKFEKEFKDIKTAEELERKKEDLMKRLKDGVDNKVLSAQDLQNFIQRISELEKKRLRETSRSIDVSKKAQEQREAVITGKTGAGGFSMKDVQGIVAKQKKKEGKKSVNVLENRETMILSTDNESLKTKFEATKDTKTFSR